MKAGRAIAALAAVAALLAAGDAIHAKGANRAPAADDVEVVSIRPNVALIAGSGANIVVQWGQNGTLLINTGREASAPRVLAEIKKLTDQPISLIVNTSAD